MLIVLRGAGRLGAPPASLAATLPPPLVFAGAAVVAVVVVVVVLGVVVVVEEDLPPPPAVLAAVAVRTDARGLTGAAAPCGRVLGFRVGRVAPVFAPATAALLAPCFPLVLVLVLARALASSGVVDAVALDGGTSATVGLRDGADGRASFAAAAPALWLVATRLLLLPPCWFGGFGGVDGFGFGFDLGAGFGSPVAVPEFSG